MENYFKNLPDFTNMNYLPKNDAFFNTAIAATKELVDINAKFASEVLETGIGFANLSVENSEKQFKVVAEVKDAEDFSARQTVLLEEYSAKVSEVAEHNIKVAQDAGEVYTAWFKKNFEAAEVVAKEAAEEVQKVAAKKPATKRTKKAA